MKTDQKRHRFLSRLLPTLVGASLIYVPTASHAATITAGNGDLFLGFRETASSTAYLVKLGTIAQFAPGGSFASGAPFTLSLGNIGTDLSNTFGASWFSEAETSWGIFGFSNVSNPSLSASRQRTSPGVVTSPFVGPTAGNLTDRSATQNQINNVLNSINGGTSTANSNFGILQTGASGSASYFNQVATTGVTDFGTTSTWTSIEGNFGNGTANTVLDLWRYPNLTVNSGLIQNLGSFAIDNSGTVTFTAAVPEPSSVGLLAFAGTAVIGFYRRRQKLTTA